ncbi:hypothetical protein DRO69_11210, partial [Candidatus Bathyarchaeota archaeon]
LGRTLAVRLDDYKLSEVRDIVSYRAEEAFLLGAISDDLIDFIANISMGYGGVRYALELMLGAGNIAELNLADSVRAEHVRMVHASIPKGANGAIYPGELSLHKQLLLKAVIEGLEASGKPYLSLDETYSSYRIVCEQSESEAEGINSVTTYLRDLSTDGYVLLYKKNGEIFVGMEYPFDRLKEILERTLKEALQYY